jgi:ABC-type transport system involved in multi-copper enzyme maturation permease subunit
MTAESTAVHPATGRSTRSNPFLGFGTVFRKELAEWLRGRAALIVGGIAIASGIFTTLIPFVVQASGEAAAGPPLSMDPTDNVLLATMALLSGERDRGTLAWSLTKPVAPVSIIAAKFVAALLVIGTTAVILPLTASVAVATIAYGAVPDVGTVGLFATLFLTLPIFYIALTVALGTFVKSTAGVAGLAFLVMFLPAIIGGLVPIVGEASPTSIGNWALAAATGQAASSVTLAGWTIAVVVLASGAKLAFDRQEF